MQVCSKVCSTNFMLLYIHVTEAMGDAVETVIVNYAHLLDNMASNYVYLMADICSPQEQNADNPA